MRETLGRVKITLVRIGCTQYRYCNFLDYHTSTDVLHRDDSTGMYCNFLDYHERVRKKYDAVYE